MLPESSIEDLLRVVSRMDRETLAARLSDFRGSFPVDFTPAFVAATDVSKLRHIYLALCLQNRRAPGAKGQTTAPVARAA